MREAALRFLRVGADGQGVLQSLVSGPVRDLVGLRYRSETMPDLLGLAP